MSLLSYFKKHSGSETTSSNTTSSNSSSSSSTPEALRHPAVKALTDRGLTPIFLSHIHAGRVGTSQFLNWDDLIDLNEHLAKSDPPSEIVMVAKERGEKIYYTLGQNTAETQENLAKEKARIAVTKSAMKEQALLLNKTKVRARETAEAVGALEAQDDFDESKYVVPVSSDVSERIEERILQDRKRKQDAKDKKERQKRDRSFYGEEDV